MPPMTPADDASAKLMNPARTPSRRLVFFCIVALALTLFVVRAQVAVSNPFFGGDQGFRMDRAEHLIARMGNRLWLPYLQTHIWVFYRLGLPAHAFKLIPCFYFLLAVCALGILAFRIAGRTYPALLFSLFLMISFAYQRQVLPLSVALYQEIIGCAFFYLLLCCGALELRKNVLLLALAGAALMTRDSMWIYLFVVTALNARRILSDRKCLASFVLLWAFLGLWLTWLPVKSLIVDGRMPVIPTEWPLMINKEGNKALSDPLLSAQSLWEALSSSQVLFLIIGLIAAWVAGKLGRGRTVKVAEPRETFEAKFKPFSLLSLAMIYGLIILFNPWEATFGGGRMAFPALEHAFVWAILLFRESLQFLKARRMLVRTLLIAGLLLALDPRALSRASRDDTSTHICHAEIQRLVQQAGDSGGVVVCMAGDRYWDLLERFVAPTLYAGRHFQEAASPIPDRCELVILPADKGMPGEEWLLEEEDCVVEGRPYRIFRRQNSW